MRPNIFEIATKELSQDAFFTWLLKWANPELKKENENLNTISTDFIKSLLKSHNHTIESISTLDAGRQWNNIDIWVDVNEKYMIIIEDKTFTNEHSNQLNRYKDFASKWCHVNQRELICIYLKTGNESKTSLGKIKDKGYSVFSRKDIIEILSRKKVENDIYSDYLKRLISIDKKEEMYETSPIKNWSRLSWQGFYQFLDNQIEVRDWKYVNNPSSSFWGLWWHFYNWNGYLVYLQIEQGNLCFKIGEVYENRGSIRNAWHRKVIKTAGEENRLEIKKPKRFGSGTYMTVALVERSAWLGDNDDIINKKRVVKKLKDYETFLDRCLMNE